ncbi:ZIP family metal transporter [Cardinium endosymbiont of Oedothorax gibbosus]|uniref:ZIP family metal transporter n=1 Tax=Cardinium endosymbiont of Oedothorax gibbosus TaxID=931101 RepID=UPI0020246D9A|nr:ZIP family metal transporter [Cardinium endosymbiont of Oedothorax gibbosus]CAH2559777.1 Zinc/iron permease family protein [Cardinium endosymbiont of Oedothorax gibbosus]
MVVAFFALFLSALLGGLVVIAQCSINILPHLLTFSGGYLLANTFLHLMPELFISKVMAIHVGGYIMIGFFLQRFIETFSAGVEHGHSIAPASGHYCVKNYKILSFLTSIALHALLDGTLLAHGHADHATQEGLLLGMMLHKFLEAVALMIVLSGFTLSVRRMLFYLTLFALAAPVGLWLSSYANHYISDYGSIILLSIVTGNFLYISATMLFEASPNHHSNQLTLWISLLGATLAALVEFLL